MRSSQSSIGEILLIVVIALIIVIGLGESYSSVMNALRVNPWVAVLMVHAALAFFLYLLSSSLRSALMLSGNGILPWTPAAVVFIGSLALALMTKKSGDSYWPSGMGEIVYVMATLTIIPFCEEIVFRGGVTPILSRFTTPVWSVWFSALVFSVAHTQPTLARLTSLKVGVVLGPFLLGICCDMIVRRWGRLWPAIAFHSACNASVYIFSALNPAWLAHFSSLYM